MSNQTSLKRVVITGVGVISSIGSGSESFWSAMMAGRSGAGPITKFNPENTPVQFACELKQGDFQPENYVSAKELSRMDLFVQYGVIASLRALEDGQLDKSAVEAERAAVVVSSGMGGLRTLEDEKVRVLDRGLRRTSPMLIPTVIINMVSGVTSMQLGWKGPSYSVVTACATSNHSISEAFWLIQRGISDVAVAGGSEAAITPLGVNGFASMKALSKRNEEPQKASRPFERDRDGFVIGEGAGVLLLESLEHAQQRGARIYAELIGVGMSADAHHITAPPESGEGAQRAIKMALDQAGLQPNDIDYVNAHGTSTPLNDASESAALRAVFGAHADKLKVSSTKSMVGHMLGAAGGVEAAATVLALHRGIIPPTINYENPDPQCDLNYVPNEPIEFQARYAISNSFGFGGQNSVLAFKAWNA